MAKDVIIALDFSSKEEVFTFLKPFKGMDVYVKVGMELYYAYGNEIVKELKAEGYRVFLDLKLHDIPMTVRKAMRNLASLGVDIVNVHASGTKAMMEAAKLGLSEGSNGNTPLLIAVTQLTSTSETVMQEELLINETIENTVVKYAQNAYQAECDGVVCSPLEAKAIKGATSEEFLTITPGVRRECDALGDQVRVMTPKRARENMSDYIVVGRPITQNENPVEVYKEIKKEFVGE